MAGNILRLLPNQHDTLTCVGNGTRVMQMRGNSGYSKSAQLESTHEDNHTFQGNTLFLIV